jgi:hypothetical protein
VYIAYRRTKQEAKKIRQLQARAGLEKSKRKATETPLKPQVVGSQNAMTQPAALQA